MSTKSRYYQKKELYDLYSIENDENKKFVIDINVDSIIHDNKKK